MNRRSMVAKLVASAIVSLWMMAVGCGGTQEEPLYVRRAPAPPPVSESAQSVELREATARRLKACVDAMSSPSVEPTHAFQYNVGVNDQGRVLKVHLRDSTLREASLEACFERTLAAMELPKDALRFRHAKPFSGGESTYSSRSSVGIVQAAAAPIALAPIVIPALGVTIIVAISFDIIRKATSGPDCQEVKNDCIAACNQTLPTGNFGFKFWNCVNQCMRTAGC